MPKGSLANRKMFFSAKEKTATHIFLWKQCYTENFIIKTHKKKKTHFPIKQKKDNKNAFSTVYLWSISFCSSLFSSSILCWSFLRLCSGGRWLRSSSVGACTNTGYWFETKKHWQASSRIWRQSHSTWYKQPFLREMSFLGF